VTIYCGVNGSETRNMYVPPTQGFLFLFLFVANKVVFRQNPATLEPVFATRIRPGT
jgi:hypothetical protein